MGDIRLFARMALAEAGLNVVLSLTLVGPLGIAGVALGTAIPNALFCLFVIAYTLARLEVRLIDYVRSCCLAPLLAASLLAGFWMLLRPWFELTTWGELMLAGGLGMAVYAGFILTLEESARTRILRAWPGMRLPRFHFTRAGGRG
jgi:peptidoglycan biosynthesis protein MviN/MurJ (putative lipid II flippase)